MNYSQETSRICQQGENWNKNTPKEVLQYAVGGLLYTPANHPSIAQGICTKRYPSLKAISLCLEDSIIDTQLEQAEEQLVLSIHTIYDALSQGHLSVDELPLVFIRPRSSEQMQRIAQKLAGCMEVLTGFILPKFSVSMGREYAQVFEKIQATLPQQKLYMMPILESTQVLGIQTRAQTLDEIKILTDSLKEHILNIRVGGNDFCNAYGFRRNHRQPIYQIGVVNSALSDIMNVFGRDYVVSGPVWEYFGDTRQEWAKGFREELALDKLNGFVGKTAIHPSQLPLIQQNLVVDYTDYTDAMEILNWKNMVCAVSKGVSSGRMNEVKVHVRWAEKVRTLAKVYGVAAGSEQCL